MKYIFFKRLFDIFSALFAIIFLMPFFIIISVIIKSSSKGPIIFRSIRTGKDNSRFYIYKFRSMIDNADKIGGLSTALNDSRVTKFGKFLRKYKLDEFPQLINVLKGEMSIVGPRAQVPYYTEKYEGVFKEILSLRPGLTDIAFIYFGDMDKVLGKTNIKEKYETIIEPKKNLLRISYVKNFSFIYDLRIIFGTIFRIFGIKNISRFDFKKFD